MKKQKRIDDLENFIIANGMTITKYQAAMNLYEFNLKDKLNQLCARRGYWCDTAFVESSGVLYDVIDTSEAGKGALLSEVDASISFERVN
jgi:hypothetical protein